ncbi:MAG: ABC transporter ATP-binding protein [Phycisphaerae bacterium]|nr:ABC transporter ATP-binding protein [Phycisphaerae bacterium]
MSRPKKRRNANFWRACQYLGAYRGIIAVSVICAFFVGGAFTGGLLTTLPIIKVLINRDTVPAWADRLIIENRLGVTLAEEQTQAKIVRITPSGLAATHGFHQFDVLSGDLQTLSQSGVVKVDNGHGAIATLPPSPYYFRWLRAIALALPSNPVATIAVIFGVTMALSVIGNVLRFFQEYLSDKAAIAAITDVRRHLYDHVLHLPMGYFGIFGTSDVTSRLVQDSQALQDGFKTLLGPSIQEPIKAAFTLGTALWLNWQLTLVIICFAPIMGTMIRRFGKKMRRANRAALQKSGDMLGQIEATLQGVRVVKAVGAERFERRRYSHIMAALLGEQLKMARYEASAPAFLETLAALVVGCVMLYASYLVLIRNTLDSGKFILILVSLVGIGESLRRISKMSADIGRSDAAAGRLFEILDMPMERRRTILASPDLAAARLKPQLQTLDRAIQFNDVSFSYREGLQPALNGVSLNVPKGQSVAIVGRNGSGKTTLLALLPRFWDPTRGTITIDDIDIRTVTLRSLRQQINIVTQESVIFPGTIAQNIAYGHPAASKPELLDQLRPQIESAARRAFCHEFIMEKPQGYDTPLDGLGGQLSGGQRQRLNIARAILRDAPILILDEATSQVDAESEHLIQQAVESIMHERTTFVIAHRFSTILSADTIVVMDRGQIVGQGKHEELLATCPTYQNLYERQIMTPA